MGPTIDPSAGFSEEREKSRKDRETEHPSRARATLGSPRPKEEITVAAAGATVECEDGTVLADLARTVADEHPEYENAEIATLLVERVEAFVAEGGSLSVLRPALIQYVSAQRRRPVRVLERTIRASWSPSASVTTRKARVAELDGQMRAYAQEYVMIPGAGRVRAGEVTLKQWEERKEMLRTEEHAVAAAAAFVEAVIKRLRRARTETIDEYVAHDS